MPTFIPDRLKTPGDFPSIDANDNQIRGFGFFADNTARSGLAEEFRCHGYLAYMKDTDQFKQYTNSSVADDAWENDSNWVLLEGQQTDTYWSVDGDGTGIYYSNQVLVGASTYNGTEKFYVSGDAMVNGSLAANSVATTSVYSVAQVHINIDSLGGGLNSSSFKVNSGAVPTTSFAVEPFIVSPAITFGNATVDFDYPFYSSSSYINMLFGGNADGFKFSDAFDLSGAYSTIHLESDSSYFDIADGGRAIKLSPQQYKISTSVEADANATHAVEMLMPDSATGDWTFNHLGNKNFVFNTSTSGEDKLITKFHAAGNGAVSIGTANYYNEYNGIQYTTVSSDQQPRLFIVNDETSSVGIRVQSGDTDLGSETERTQPRYFTDMRDDGFYISRYSTGPSYNDTSGSWSSGSPSAVASITRGAASGNDMTISAGSNFLFKSNGQNVFQIFGGQSSTASPSHYIALYNHGESASPQSMTISSFVDGTFKYRSSAIGDFLVVYAGENRITSGEQILSSLFRGADFKVTLTNSPTSNVTPALQVYSLLGKADNTGYWWGEDGTPYDTEAEMLAAGTALDADKLADQLAIYVPKHGSGKVGIGTTSPTAKLHVEGDSYFGQIGTFHRNNNTWSRPHLYFSRLDENSSSKNVGVIGSSVDSTITEAKGYRFYLTNTARGTVEYTQQNLAILENGDVEIKTASSESSSNIEGEARLSVVGETSDDSKGALTVKDSSGNSLLFVRNDGNVGIGTSSPTAKLQVEGTLKSKFGIQNIGWPTEDMSIYNITDNTGYIRFINTTSGAQNEAMRIMNDGRVGIGTTNPLAKLHVFDSSVAIGNVASYNGALSGNHSSGAAVPNSLHLHATGLVMSGGRFIISSPDENIFANSSYISFKPGNAESNRQATLGIGDTSGFRIGTDTDKFHYVFGKYGASITDNTDTVGTTVDKPLFIKPRFPNATNASGYTGGGNDGTSVNQSFVHPLYFTYDDAPSTLENIRIRTQVNDSNGASYDYGLDYDATATQGATGNPFTADKNRLKISATFPFAESQTAGGLHTQLSGVISTSEASLEIRNAYETDVSGGSNPNLSGTINTALYVGGQRFFEPRSRNNTYLYGFGGVAFTRSANYGTTGDLSPEGNDLVNAITTDVTSGTVGSYVLSTSNAGEITIGSSTYNTVVDGELSLKVTLNAADNVSSIEIISGGNKITGSTGFRSGDTITIPATKLGGSSTQVVITLADDSFVTDGALISMSLLDRSRVSLRIGQASITDNQTSTESLDLGAGGSFHLARTLKYTSYRDHWFTFIEGGELGTWSTIQGGFLKGAKAMVGYSSDNQVAYDGTAVSTSDYGSAALRIVASPSGMRVGTHAVASNSSATLKFAESDLDAAGFTNEDSTWSSDYDTNGGWYIGMPIYISEAGTNHMISKVRPDGVFQYNSGSDTSTFQRRTVVDIDNLTKELTLDSSVTTSGGDVLVYPRTESDLIRCRNLMGRDMFVVKSNGRLDVESGLIKMRTSEYSPVANHSTLGADECIIYYDGTSLKIIKGSGTSVPTTIG